jgi:hypothetical protein
MKTVLMMLMAVALASASTVTFLGTSGANNGSVFVGPYSLIEDDLYISGTCISFDLHVGPPWTWQAEREYIGSFSGPMRTELLEAEWLNQQFASNSDWAGIQQAIWTLFGAGYSDPDTLSWVARSEANWGSVDPNSFYVLVPVTLDETQSYLVDVPEPGMFWLIGGGLVAIGAAGRRMRTSHR